MQFMALIYSDEQAWESMPDEERASTLERYLEFGKRGRKSGSVVGGDELAPTSAATTVRVRGAETKEQIGGIFLTDLPDLDTAISIAAKIPAAEHGSIEVRPVVER